MSKDLLNATNLAIDHVISHGSDDIFKTPVFPAPVERRIIDNNEDEFVKFARKRTLKFLNAANLKVESIGSARRCNIVRDYRSYRQVCWLDPIDSIKYLALSILVSENIEKQKLEKEKGIIHSHRLSDDKTQLFDRDFGYGSFKEAAGTLANESVGKWMVTTDISNFFDRISHHSLENHLQDFGAEGRFFELINGVLGLWGGDRRSFGLPVGSDGSRILSEAVLVPIDQKLHDRGFQFVRYVDDYRFIAPTQSAGQYQLLVLSELLAEEGLALNARKTSIQKIIPNFTEKAQETGFSVEHEKIDTDAKVVRKVPIKVSGRTSFSKRFERPGRDAMKKLMALEKQEVIDRFERAEEAEFEDTVKLVVKFFIYVEQDIELLAQLLDRRLITCFYICDALIKEGESFDADLRIRIVKLLKEKVAISDLPYPYKMPFLRLFSTKGFLDDKLAKEFFDNYRVDENLVFYREFLLTAAPNLDRARMRKLARDKFNDFPDFVQRAIFLVTAEHHQLTKGERRPMLKSMQEATSDWFIDKAFSVLSK